MNDNSGLLKTSLIVQSACKASKVQKCSKWTKETSPPKNHFFSWQNVTFMLFLILNVSHPLKPFSWRLCDTKYTQSHSLNNHINSIHNDNLWIPIKKMRKIIEQQSEESWSQEEITNENLVANCLMEHNLQLQSCPPSSHYKIFMLDEMTLTKLLKIWHIFGIWKIIVFPIFHFVSLYIFQGHFLTPRLNSCKSRKIWWGLKNKNTTIIHTHHMFSKVL